MTSRRARIVKQSGAQRVDTYLDDWYRRLVADYSRFVPPLELHLPTPSPKRRRWWR